MQDREIERLLLNEITSNCLQKTPHGKPQGVFNSLCLILNQITSKHHTVTGTQQVHPDNQPHQELPDMLR